MKPLNSNVAARSCLDIPSGSAAGVGDWGGVAFGVAARTGIKVGIGLGGRNGTGPGVGVWAENGVAVGAVTVGGIDEMAGRLAGLTVGAGGAVGCGRAVDAGSGA